MEISQIELYTGHKSAQHNINCLILPHNPSPPLQNLPKHEKYKISYKPNDIFWGLGVEHETYIESIAQQRSITESDVRTCQRPERYSVSYYKSYRPAALSEGIQNLFLLGPTSRSISYLLNAHAFNRTDIFNQPQTTYEKNPRSNPKFSGQTLHEYLCSKNKWFQEMYEHIYLFDGDTVEFTTVDFYKANPRSVIAELSRHHRDFIENLNLTEFPENSTMALLAPFCIQTANHAFATYTTNMQNISMFNNGTIHINITLPTKLNSLAEIEDWPCFIQQHRILARLFQWIEPLLIAVHGTPDPFWRTDGGNYIYGGASQRLAVSRYIGVGTYDTTAMPLGKILQVERTSLPWEIQTSKGGWYSDASDWGYEPLNCVGLDINFNKHRNHGLEFRIFDALPMDSLEELLCIIVKLGDIAVRLNGTLPPVPQESIVWKKLIRGAIERGREFVALSSDFAVILGILGFPADRLPSDGLPADRLPADRLPADRLPADGLPADGWTLERCYGDLRRGLLNYDCAFTSNVDCGQSEDSENSEQSNSVSTESCSDISNTREVEIVVPENTRWCVCF